MTFTTVLRWIAPVHLSSVCALLAACSASPANPGAAPVTPSVDRTTAPPATSASAAAASSVSPGAPEPAATAASSAVAVEPAVEEWDSPLRFERVLDKPVRSLALGRSPFAAVLSDQPWMLDASGWRELPLPSDMLIRAESSPVGIFFGRDDKPRMMGAIAGASAGAWTPVYYRWRAGRWERDKKEIGRLSGEPLAGLYGVLGDEDPEVVCKIGDICIIKRRTGWKMIPAGKTLERVWVVGGAAYSLGPEGMKRLEKEGWADVPWTFEGRGKESGFWAGDGQGWVSAASQNALYRVEAAGRFTRMRSPVKAPLAIWGASASDVWVVGADGVGHYDGATWRRVRGLEGSFWQVQGRGGEVWVGGPGGLWRGVR